MTFHLGFLPLDRYTVVYRDLGILKMKGWDELAHALVDFRQSDVSNRFPENRVVWNNLELYALACVTYFSNANIG